MPALDWIGKAAVVNHHADVPYRLLEPARTLSFPPSRRTKGADVTDTSGNIIVQGDNLHALKALLPRYAGKVKCIYIDPPYNTGNEGWVYNDNVNSPEIQQWLYEVVGHEGEDLTRHDKWLCMMYPRLKLLRDLLTEDGAIYVQLDYNEVHYAKALMDEIFGRRNFQREIIWRIGWLSGFKSADNNWVRNHDTLLVYSKNAGKLDFMKQYNQPKDYLERFNGAAAAELAQYFKDLGLSKKMSKQAVEYAATVGLPKRYPLEDTWNASPYDKLNSIAIVSYSGEKVSKLLDVEEFKGQKSVELIKRILRAHTGNGDVVLDSFAGTGTTGHAVMDLNKEDGQNRKFILVELDKDVAERITAARLVENIKKNEYKESFQFCRLSKAPMFAADGEVRNDVEFGQLAEFVWFVETGSGFAGRTDSPLIGEYEGRGVYLLYNGILKDRSVNGGNILTGPVLDSLPRFDGPKVIYAAACRLGAARLAREGIVFKQTPYALEV